MSEPFIVDGEGDLVKDAPDPLDHESHPLVHRSPRQRNQIVPIRLISLHQRIAGSPRFVEILLALAILAENLFPRRRYKNERVVTKLLSGLAHVRRHNLPD